MVVGEQANRQHVASVDQNQLAKETDLLARMLAGHCTQMMDSSLICNAWCRCTCHFGSGKTDSKVP